MDPGPTATPHPQPDIRQAIRHHRRSIGAVLLGTAVAAVLTASVASAATTPAPSSGKDAGAPAAGPARPDPTPTRSSPARS